MVKFDVSDKMSEYDLDESDIEEERDNEDRDSDEDTEDASETDMVKQEEEYTEIKEQMYQDKLANLKKQLQQLQDGVHPEYLRRLKKLEQVYQDRIILNDVFQMYEMERVEREYINEQKQSAREFEEKKIELKESLIVELEEKKRMIEAERSTIELTGDSMDVKPVTTRKLRRRPNDPIPIPEKRRKTSPAQLNYLLDENEIIEDLKILNKGKLPIGLRKQDYSEQLSNENGSDNYEARIEDGKLYYDKKWYHRGQPVYFESRDMGKCSGVICAISTTEIWIRKTIDNSKIRIYVSQLQRGKFSIRRRSS